MRPTVCIVALMVSLIPAVVPATAATEVFLLAGQSNMEGEGITSGIQPPYQATQSAVKFWNYNGTAGNGWVNLQAGCGSSPLGVQFGPEVSFGYTLHNTLFPKDDIYLVKWGVSGASLAGLWNPNGANNAYTTLKSRADAAMQDLTTRGLSPTIAGMIWMQGESDALDHTIAPAYTANLQNPITKVRSDFNTPNMPFVVGRILTYWGAPDDNALVRAAQETIPSQVSHVSWINTDNLGQWTEAPRTGHFNTQGQVDLGIRFANKLVNTPEPSTLILAGTGLLALAGYRWRKRMFARHLNPCSGHDDVSVPAHHSQNREGTVMMMVGRDTMQGRVAQLNHRPFLGQDAIAVIGMVGFALAASWFAIPAVGAETAASGNASKGEPNRKPPKLNSKTLFLASPQPRTAIWVNTFYTQGKGLEKMCVMTCERNGDVLDDWQRRFSPDNGKSWSAWEAIEHKVKTPQGVHRQYPLPGWIDPVNGRMLVMVLDGILPRDDPMEGMARWSVRYRVSTDGGRTFAVDEPVIQKGNYTAEHPVEGVWIGKNSIQTSAGTGMPIRTRQGRVLVPVQITPLGPDGKYWSPGGGYTYTDVAVLVGVWTDGMKIEWEISERVKADPMKSTRGLVEPTIAEMPDGRILMVMRGSNNVEAKSSRLKWYSVSADGGLHWSRPKPWTYTDGSNFFSPSSCSQLLRHSNGHCYWLGNISPNNPAGNNPRYPLFYRRSRSQEPAVVKGDPGNDRHEGARRSSEPSAFQLHGPRRPRQRRDRAGNEPLHALSQLAGRCLYLSHRAVAGLFLNAQRLWSSHGHTCYNAAMFQASRRCFLKVSTAAAGGAVAAGVSLAAAAEGVSPATPAQPSPAADKTNIRRSGTEIGARGCPPESAPL